MNPTVKRNHIEARRQRRALEAWIWANRDYRRQLPECFTARLARMIADDPTMMLALMVSVYEPKPTVRKIQYAARRPEYAARRWEQIEKRAEAMRLFPTNPNGRWNFERLAMTVIDDAARPGRTRARLCRAKASLLTKHEDPIDCMNAMDDEALADEFESGSRDREGHKAARGRRKEPARSWRTLSARRKAEPVRESFQEPVADPSDPWYIPAEECETPTTLGR